MTNAVLCKWIKAHASIKYSAVLVPSEKITSGDRFNLMSLIRILSAIKLKHEAKQRSEDENKWICTASTLLLFLDFSCYSPAKMLNIVEIDIRIKHYFAFSLFYFIFNVCRGWIKKRIAYVLHLLQRNRAKTRMWWWLVKNNTSKKNQIWLFGSSQF